MFLSYKILLQLLTAISAVVTDPRSTFQLHRHKCVHANLEQNDFPNLLSTLEVWAQQLCQLKVKKTSSLRIFYYSYRWVEVNFLVLSFNSDIWHRKQFSSPFWKNNLHTIFSRRVYQVQTIMNPTVLSCPPAYDLQLSKMLNLHFFILVFTITFVAKWHHPSEP